MPEKGSDGRFQASVTPEDVLDVFEEVEGPVITSSDVADVLDCSTDTAKRKLETLAGEEEIAGRETAGRTVWWRVEALRE